MIDWNAIRMDFPVAKNTAYFLSAAASPIPTPVLDAILKNYRDINAYGDIHWQREIKEYDILLGRIAKLLRTASENLAFLPNTSTAMALTALALKQNCGAPFNVVSMMDEFPATTVPFEFQKIDMRYCESKDGRYRIGEIIKRCDDDTLAVVTSYIQSGTGFRQDLKALGSELRRRGILFIVNATQGFPIFPIDVEEMNIDAMTCSMHKWGYTGHIGSLFFTTPNFRKNYPSPLAGWLSIVPPHGNVMHMGKNIDPQRHESAAQYTFGGLNLQTINAFGAALDYLEKIGWENIRSRIFELSDHLIAGLHSAEASIISPIANIDERSASVSFRLGEATPTLMKYLEQENIQCAFRGNGIRASVNIFNTIEEIDRLVGAIESYKKAHKG